MNSYLLLRNNQETGPYSLEQLINYGLKAYDLVWINGKSAAWRYPSEITELSAVAPAIEEQPFDRFYNNTAKPDSVKKPEKKIIPIFSPSKSVFVTLPTQMVERNETRQSFPIEYQKYLPKNNDSEIKEKSTISISENDSTATIKFSQPLDEIKEMYVRTYQQRKQKQEKNLQIISFAKKAGIVAAMIATGVFIGFSINSKKQEQPILSTLTSPPTTALSDKQPEAIDESFAEKNIDKRNNDISFSGQVEEVKSEPTTTNQIRPTQKSSSIAKKGIDLDKKGNQLLNENIIINPRQQIKNSIDYSKPKDAIQVNNQTGERTKRVRDESSAASISTQTIDQTETAKAVMKNNPLKKLVTVSSNEYSKVAFGGIRNLELSINNSSTQPLGEVLVELQYLKPNKEPLKTVTVLFSNIAAGATQTKRLPDTNRGMDVKYAILSIHPETASIETASAHQ